MRRTKCYGRDIRSIEHSHVEGSMEAHIQQTDLNHNNCAKIMTILEWIFQFYFDSNLTNTIIEPT